MLKGSKCFVQKIMHCEPICVFLKSSCILRKKSLLRQSICASLPRLDDMKMKWSFLFRDLRCHRSWQESSKSACINLFSLTFSNCCITYAGIWNQVKKIHVLTNAKCRYHFTREIIASLKWWPAYCPSTKLVFESQHCNQNGGHGRGW